MKLSAWAKKIGISYVTAWRWHKAGKIPYRTEKMPSGTIIVYENEPIKKEKDTLIPLLIHPRKNILKQPGNPIK